jgi:hypothetical protein
MDKNSTESRRLGMRDETDSVEEVELVELERLHEYESGDY